MTRASVCLATLVALAAGCTTGVGVVGRVTDADGDGATGQDLGADQGEGDAGGDLGVDLGSADGGDLDAGSGDGGSGDAGPDDVGTGDAGTLNCHDWTFSAGANGRIANATVAGAFTLDGWARVLEAPAGVDGQLVGVESNAPCDGAAERWSVRVDAAGTTVTASGGASFVTSTGAGGSVALGTWFHFALVHDGANDVRLYVDGGLVQTQSSAGPSYAATCALHVASDLFQASAVSMQLASLRLSTGERFTSDFDAGALHTLSASAETAWLFDVPGLVGSPLLDTVAGLELRSDMATAQTASPDCP
ncbi:MAG: hypothetical protein H6726_11380 [Sandaracinaceae bacterium]|nr:hypothetical protein [Sandaracinaceae bacterium]